LRKNANTGLIIRILSANEYFKSPDYYYNNLTVKRMKIVQVLWKSIIAEKYFLGLYHHTVWTPANIFPSPEVILRRTIGPTHEFLLQCTGSAV